MLAPPETDHFDRGQCHGELATRASHLFWSLPFSSRFIWAHRSPELIVA